MWPNRSSEEVGVEDKGFGHQLSREGVPMQVESMPIAWAHDSAPEVLGSLSSLLSSFRAEREERLRGPLVKDSKLPEEPWHVGMGLDRSHVPESVSAFLAEIISEFASIDRISINYAGTTLLSGHRTEKGV